VVAEWSQQTAWAFSGHFQVYSEPKLYGMEKVSALMVLQLVALQMTTVLLLGAAGMDMTSARVKILRKGQGLPVLDERRKSDTFFG
jgi:hypothetical protein